MGTHKLVLGGCYEGGECKCVTSSDTELCPRLKCNADTRVWLYVVNRGGIKKLLFSPDTDVYIIGLTNVNHDKIDVYIQISLLSSLSARFLHLNKLNQVLCTNPGLVMVQQTPRAQVLQTLFICSGCDYISVFADFGKCTLMKCFMKLMVHFR